MSAAQQINRVEAANRDATILSTELQSIVDGKFDTTNSKLDSLRQDNSKLAYQLQRLNTAVSELAGPTAPPLKMEPLDYTTKGVCFIPRLDVIFRIAIAKAFPGFECDNARIARNAARVAKPSKKKAKVSTEAVVEEAQYQSAIAMSLFKQLKGTPNEQKSPLDVAKAIIQKVPDSELVENCVAGGAGFINIYIKKSLVNKLLIDILNNGVKPPPLAKKLKVIVDFSSPNIAKEMHVGHLRSTIIGECICRMLEFTGYDVDRVNHIGDWGTQFGQLIVNLQDKYPNYKTEELPLKDLQTFYKASKVRFENEPDFQKRAHQAVVDLQAGDPDVTRAWKLIVDVSRREYEKVYKSLGVTLFETGESFYQSRMIQLVKDLEGAGLVSDGGDKLEKMRGCKVVWTKHKVPLILEKSNGGYGYDTSDLATIRYRSQELKGDWLIYVVDEGQSTHFQGIFQAARDIGWVTDKQRVDHVAFGVVLGEDGLRMKSRSGDTVTLKSVLDEGLVRATNQRELKAQERIARGVKVPTLTQAEKEEADVVIGTSCLKYADLSQNRTMSYKFSFEKMLADKGNTATYIISAYTRIMNVLKQKEVEGFKLIVDENAQILLTDHNPTEWKLAQHLIRFHDELNRATQDLMPNYLCDFLYELASTVHEFYEACHIIERNKETGACNVNVDRLLQFCAAGRVMKQCFELVGLRFVDKM